MREAMKELKTVEMEVALMRYFNFRHNLIVPNVSWGINIANMPDLHECDLLLLSKSGYATEVEIKVSKADLIKDFDKKHCHFHPAIKHLYYAVTEPLKELALKCVPEYAGIITVRANDESYYQPWYDVVVVRKAKAARRPYKWNERERLQLLRLGCLRIYGLKKKLVRNGKATQRR